MITTPHPQKNIIMLNSLLCASINKNKIMFTAHNVILWSKEKAKKNFHGVKVSIKSYLSLFIWFLTVEINMPEIEDLTMHPI